MCNLLNEKGVITIEGTISFSIVAIILLNLGYLVKYIIINEEIDLIIKMSLIEFQIDNYKTYDFNNLENILSKRIKEKNILKNISDMKMKIAPQDEYCNVIFEYKYDMPFRKITGYNFSRIKTIGIGKSIEEYGIVQEVYETKEDIWNYSNIKRGITISNILGKNLKSDGNKIDVLENQTLKSIVSIDVRKKSYVNSLEIYETLKKEINGLYNFSSGKIGEMYIEKSMYNKKQIIIAIPNVEIPAYCINELTKLKEYCYDLNIQCRIVKVGD